ncbi:hypothetical protein B0H19DRAFT_1181453 [Mycena capillaripes]|nr:hypothetical protein B0H19DRAFT_1181453 [Mycena capillaripes]
MTQRRSPLRVRSLSALIAQAQAAVILATHVFHFTFHYSWLNYFTLQHSSGRGGAGNFRAYSNAAHPSPSGEQQDFPWSRGSPSTPVSRPASGMRSTGRGGFGNIKRYPTALEPPCTRCDGEIQRSRSDMEGNTLRSSGRGGIGNIAPAVPHSVTHRFPPVSLG